MVLLRPKRPVLILVLLFTLTLNVFAFQQNDETISRFSIQEVSNAVDRINFNWDDQSSFALKNEMESEVVLPTFRTLIPVDEAADPSITNVDYDVSETPVPESIRVLLELEPDNVQIAQIVKNVVFREVFAVEIEILPFVKVEGIWYPIESVSVDLENLNYRPQLSTASSSFANLYNDVFTGLDDLDETGTQIVSGGYLVVGGQMYLDAIEDWIDWKKQCGYPIHEIVLEGTPHYNNVRNDIQDAYFSINPKPEYLLLVGDPVVGTMNMPTTYFVSNQAAPYVTDHPYVMIEGEDYFPEMWVGRWSVTTVTEAVTVARKTVAYEKGTVFDEVNDDRWVERGLVLSNNYHPSVGMLQGWLENAMLDFGFDNVQIISNPPEPDPNTVIQAINTGKGWVNYRGFGHPGGWHQPTVTTDLVAQLGNNWKTPIVTSIVCGGNRFDAATEPCMSEIFLRCGSANVPRGAVAFIGPSEEFTSTRWNNCLNTAFYRGLFQEGLTQLAPLLHRGKMGLWEAFPNNRGWGDSHSSVHLYFLAYGIMGDPGLLVRTVTPVEMTFDVQQTLPFGSNDLPVQVIRADDESLAGVAVTAFSPAGIQRTLVTDESGLVRFTFSDNEIDNMGDQIFLTGICYNTIPALDTVHVGVEELAVRLDSLTVSGIVEPGETITITPYLSNSGTQTQGVFDGYLWTIDPSVTLIDSTNSYPTLGGTGNQADPMTYSFLVEQNVNDREDLNLILDLDFGGDSVSVALPLIARAPRISISPEMIQVGESGSQEFDLIVNNLGLATSESGTLLLELPEDIDMVIVQGEQDVNSIPSGAFETITGFETNIGPHIISGDVHPIEWTFENTDGRLERGVFNLRTGSGGEGFPSSADRYGYRAYSIDDTTYWSCPEYNWLEISPGLGGEGTLLPLYDIGPELDAIVPVELPFEFTYYGNTFEQIAVCSNGWISLGETPDPYFRNWNLPDGPGPGNMLCPFWDDLFVSGDVSAWYDDFSNRFIVEWSRVRIPINMGPDESLSFQIILYDPAYHTTNSGDGDIEFIYKEIYDRDTSENYSTVGIRNEDGTDGLQISYANNPGENEIFSESAQRISTDIFPNGIAIKSNGSVVDDTDGNDNGLIETGETIDIYPSLKNFGNVASGEVSLQVDLMENDDVSLLTGTTSIASIEPGQTGVAQSPISVSVGLLAPHQSSFNLMMTAIADEDTLRKYYESHMIVAPHLELIERNLEDTIPDGDGDGYAEAGETITLRLEYQNTGGLRSLPVELEIESIGPMAEVIQGTSQLAEADPGEAVTSGELVVDIDEACANLSILKFPVTMTYEGELVKQDTVIIQVGEFVFSETFETPLNEQWVEVGDYFDITDEDYVSPSHSLKWSFSDQPGYPPGQVDLMVSDTFRLPNEAHIRLRYYKAMSPEDVFIIKFRTTEGELIPIGSRYGLTLDWSTWDQDVQGITGNPDVQLLIYVITSQYPEGNGLMLDDILITDGFTNSVELEDSQIPTEYSMSEAWPNPFNPATVVKIGLPENGNLKVTVFNLLGQKVADLANSTYPAGYHNLHFNGNGLSSGIYFIHTEVENQFIQTRKIMLMQ